ncbi:MAG: DUF5610 domain-containing protein [Candidatus Hydrogenedentota bacterium]
MFEFSTTASYNRNLIQAKYHEAYGASALRDESYGQSDDLKPEVLPQNGDILDLGNSRGLLPNSETLMAILEEKVNARVDVKFRAELETDETGEEEADNYWSPENTAGRIVGFALKFYEKFAEKNGGSSEENLDRFLGIVGDAIEEGIGQAEAVISETAGGKVPDENSSVINKTRAAIASLLEEFRQEILDGLNGAPEGDDNAVTEEADPATVLN